MTQRLLENDAENLALNTILLRKADVEEQLRIAREHEAQMDRAKQMLQAELENASAYIIDLENKFYKSQQTSLELLKQLKMLEFENEELLHEIE